MQIESLFRSALSNQSLRLYKKNQFYLLSGMSVFRDSAKMTAELTYPSSVKSNKWRRLKQKNVEDG